MATSSAPAVPLTGDGAVPEVALTVKVGPVVVVVVTVPPLNVTDPDAVGLGKLVDSDTVRQRNRSQMATCRPPAVTHQRLQSVWPIGQRPSRSYWSWRWVNR